MTNSRLVGHGRVLKPSEGQDYVDWSEHLAMSRRKRHVLPRISHRHLKKNRTGYCYMQNTEDVEWEKCHLGNRKTTHPGCGKIDRMLRLLQNKRLARVRRCQTTTKSGLPCQKWSAQYPHKHRYGNPNTNESEYGQSTSEYYNVSQTKRQGSYRAQSCGSQLCRNPSGNKDGPWCCKTRW